MTTVVTAGQRAENVSQSINSITTARQLVDGLIALLSAQTEARRNGEETVNDTTYFGTLTAVLGVAAKSIAARNVGAGVAGISAATGAHYQLDKQKTAFKTALSSAQCLQAKLNGIDEDTYELFPNYVLGKEGDTDYDKLYAAIPGLAYERYVDIVSQLSDDLDGISTASGSLSDVQGVVEAAHDAASKAAAVKAGGGAGQAKVAQDNLRAADDAVTSANAKLQAVSSQAHTSSKSGAGNDLAGADSLPLALAQQQVEAARKDREKAAKAADPSAVPKRTAFLVAVVSFKANSELCTKVTVRK